MSSDTAMDTPDSHHEGGTTIRGRKPDPFHGERAKLAPWILQMERYFHLEGDRIADDDKAVVATTYMKGDAEKWVAPTLEKYLDNDVEDAENAATMENWNVFKAKLKQAFSPAKEALIAGQCIQTLRQTRSAADYTILFQQYAERLDWNDEALMSMYKQGLKSGVRAELMRSGASTATLSNLMDEAIRLDNELFALGVEERGYRKGNHTSPPSHPKYRPNDYRSRRGHRPRVPGAYAHDGPEAMHLTQGPNDIEVSMSLASANC